MTRKDFIVIADVLKDLPTTVRDPLVTLFSLALKRNYPKFDPITFRNYIEGK